MISSCSRFHTTRTSTRILLAGIALASLTLVATFIHATTPAVGLPTVTDSTLTKGKQFTTSVTLANAVDLFSWQLNVTFNRYVLNVVNITLGVAWNDHPGFVVQRLNNTQGNLLYAFTYSQSPSSSASYTGSGPRTMVTVRWVVMKNLGTTQLHFVLPTENSKFGTVMLDSMSREIAYSSEDGYFSNYLE